MTCRLSTRLREAVGQKDSGKSLAGEKNVAHLKACLVCLGLVCILIPFTDDKRRSSPATDECEQCCNEDIDESASSTKAASATRKEASSFFAHI
jgi:hypothetical protein